MGHSGELEAVSRLCECRDQRLGPERAAQRFQEETAHTRERHNGGIASGVGFRGFDSEERGLALSARSGSQPWFSRNLPMSSPSSGPQRGQKVVEKWFSLVFSGLKKCFSRWLKHFQTRKTRLNHFPTTLRPRTWAEHRQISAESGLTPRPSA